MIVITSGDLQLQQMLDNQRKIASFKMSTPISSPMISLAAGPFEVNFISFIFLKKKKNTIHCNTFFFIF